MKEENIDKFLRLFEDSKESILKFPGCLSLNLQKDINNSCIFFTLSTWENETDLNNYRSSGLFESIWKQTKILFNNPAEAWSLVEIVCNY